MPLFKEKKERNVVCLIIIGLILLSVAPQLIGAWRANDEYVFTGTNFTQTYDYPVYLSSIEQARQGNFLSLNLYTSENQRAVLFSPLWWVLGNISRLTTLSPIIIFHLARALSGGLLLAALYWLTGKMFADSRQRLMALLVVGASSGWGTWAFLQSGALQSWSEIFYRAPIDLWVSEANTFLTLYHSPLFIVSQLLLVVIMFSWLEKKYQWWLPLASGLLALLHPYDVFIVTVVGGLWLIGQIFYKTTTRQQLVNLTLTAAGIVPVIFYYQHFVLTESVMAGWAARNITLTPPLINWLLGYGWLIPLAVIGLVKIKKDINQCWLMIILWLVSAVLLLSAPLDIARRFSNGLHIPLSLLAARGGWDILLFLKNRFVWRAIFIWIVGGGLFLTNITIVAQDIYSYQNYTLPNYLPQDYYNGARWLANNTLVDSAILAEPSLGNLLPAFSGRRVFVGHGHQTIDFEKKSQAWQDFLSSNDDDEHKKNWLHQMGVDYLWFDQQTAKTSSFLPGQKKYLQPAWISPSLTIYRLE